MTATIRTPEPRHARATKNKPRRTRFASMESLGFIESPATVSTSWPASHQTTPISAADSANRPKRGAHERTVADLEPTDTTELLVRSNLRWGLLTIMALLVGALTVGTIWLIQRPAVQADSAATAMQSAAQSLRPELISLSGIAGRLADQDLDSTAIAAQTRAVDARARELFNAAGALPTTSSGLRGAAADVATSALDASRLINDAAAYRATVIQILIPPPLETDPELVALDEAVRAFGAWQQSFNQVRSALPTGTMTRVSDQLALLAGNLESIQSRYVDALRDDDTAAARAVVRDLADQLAVAETALRTSVADVESRALDLIELGLAGIEGLLR